MVEGKRRSEWPNLRTEILDLMQREARIQQIVKLVGSDVLPDEQKLVLDVAAIFKNTFSSSPPTT